MRNCGGMIPRPGIITVSADRRLFSWVPIRRLCRDGHPLLGSHAY